MSWRPFAKWHHDVIIVYLLLILLILVSFNKLPLLQPQFLTDFHKQGCILKLRISSFPPCIICEDAWWFTYESQKTMTKFAIQVFFLQNALVEYIGVYSDTKNGRKFCDWSIISKNEYSLQDFNMAAKSHLKPSIIRHLNIQVKIDN